MAALLLYLAACHPPPYFLPPQSFMDHSTPNVHSPGGALQMHSSVVLSAALNGDNKSTSSFYGHPAGLKRSAGSSPSDASGAEEEDSNGLDSSYRVSERPQRLS